MRRALIFIVIIVILIGSGFLTTQLVGRTPDAPPVPGMRVQTTNGAASALVATPEKGTLFLLFAGFVVFNLVGIGATLALISWFLTKQINKAKAAPPSEFSFSLATNQPNSLGGALAKRPAITIGLLLILVIGAAVTAAALGVFTPR